MVGLTFPNITSWSPLASEDVLEDLVRWQETGLRTALVTLINIEGTTPRPLGAQMAVAEDGRYSGYLSGGCLEEAVALDAVRAIREGSNRLVRYGRGSRYVDIKLPCGSGLDLYIDQRLDQELVTRALASQAQRLAFHIETDLTSGESTMVPTGAGAAHDVPVSMLRAQMFRRAYMPGLTVLLLGNGPAVVALAHLLTATGIGLLIGTADERTRADLAMIGASCHAIEDVLAAAIDPWTGAVLAFHDHEREAALLARLIASDCFYIGALGGKAARDSRIAALRAFGLSDEQIARVRGPIGLVPGAKSRGLMAAGVVAEILAEAKAKGLVA